MDEGFKDMREEFRAVRVEISVVRAEVSAASRLMIVGFASTITTVIAAVFAHG